MSRGAEFCIKEGEKGDIQKIQRSGTMYIQLRLSGPQLLFRGIEIDRFKGLVRYSL